MAKRDNKHERRIKRFIVGTGLFTVLLATSTYAWFIGMKTVDVTPFEVKIATTESLYLSLDGKTWSYEVSINKDNYDTASYENNTNSWGGKGLIPMSSVGVINTTTSKLELYEKGSLTATDGGYRLMASKVENTATEEKDGYVAFDLFIKNLSGNEYYTQSNVKNEEGIYLTPDSVVTVATNGGIEDTGIENSVRVAFAQIGRVIATTGIDADADDYEDQIAKITGISCAEDVTGVTPICDTRTAQIWEPNDTDHVENAIHWYSTSCRKRVNAELYDDDDPEYTAYDLDTDCKEIENGYHYDTYAVNKEISYTDNVDVYDGKDYNYFEGSSDDGKLYAFPTFTDTMKNTYGPQRPEFMTLAPNSITKVRIYVYIEGQDVDNYDFASLGKAIEVSFGLSKERFYDEDVQYNPEGTATLPDDVIKENHKDPTPVIVTSGD